jgi:hypothetical protein
MAPSRAATSEPRTGSRRVDDMPGLGEVVGGDCAGTSVRHQLRCADLTLTMDQRTDELLGRDPLALLLGMLFDQHMRRRSS